jgi:hypothetical protein
MSEKLEIELEKAQLIDELLLIETEIDNLWDYCPDNPKRVDVRTSLIKLESLKKEIEEKLESLKNE